RLRAGRRTTQSRSRRPTRRPGGPPMSAPARTRTSRADSPKTAPALHRSTDSAWATLRRGIALSPEFTRGLAVTVALAVLATVGKVVVPLAVQQIIDNGLL